MGQSYVRADDKERANIQATRLAGSIARLSCAGPRSSRLGQGHPCERRIDQATHVVIPVQYRDLRNQDIALGVGDEDPLIRGRCSDRLPFHASEGEPDPEDRSNLIQM
jgi:hypothetical protein